MDWEKALLRKEAGTVENTLFNIISNLSNRRKETHCLHGNAKETVILLESNTIFCVEKTLKEENILLIGRKQKHYWGLKKNEEL
jgi:hypothetical protein